MPQNLAFAAAPLVFAVLIERLGTTGTLVAATLFQFVALVAMLALLRRLSPP